MKPSFKPSVAHIYQFHNWASSWDYGTYRIGEHRRLRRVRAVSPEPSLFAHINYGSRRRVGPKNQSCSHGELMRMRVCRLFTEGDRCHNLMSRLIWLHPPPPRALSPQLGMSESIPLWHFKPSLLILTFFPQTIRDWNSPTDSFLSAAQGAEDCC